MRRACRTVGSGDCDIETKHSDIGMIRSGIGMICSGIGTICSGIGMICFDIGMICFDIGTADCGIGTKHSDLLPPSPVFQPLIPAHYRSFPSFGAHLPSCVTFFRLARLTFV